MNRYYNEYLNKNIINDMDLMDSIFNKIDNTITEYGKLKLKQKLKLISTDNLPFLINLNYQIFKDEEYKIIVKDFLININKLIPDVKIYYDYKYKDEFFFKTSFLNFSWLLNISNKLKFSNAFIPILIYFIIYVYFKYKNIPISIKGYLQNIYNSYIFMSKMILNLFIKNKNYIHYGSLIVCYGYISYQIYNFYITFYNSLGHYKECNKVSNEFNNIVLFIKKIKKMSKYDNYISTPEISKICDELLLDFKQNSNIGYHLSMKLYCDNYKNKFTKICNYIGNLDARLCICDLLNYGYSLPLININSKTPFIICENLWHPIIEEKSVKNNICIKKNNIVIITGPNQSGKSTFMRTLMINIILAQSLGIACCDNIYFTPFKKLYTYLNIPDNIGRESLFEAETNRCIDYIKKVEDNYLVFGIIDELFTGTDPASGISCTKSVINSLSNYKNSITILSTHFKQVCVLNNTDYYNFMAIKKNNKYIFPYKLYKGISNQNIAIEILKEKGYNQNIINNALIYLKEFI